MRRPRSRIELEACEGRVLLSTLFVERENNDRANRANAVTVPADGLVHVTGTARGRGDRDFFVFTAPATGGAAVGVTTNGRLAPQVEIEDASGLTVLETQPRDGVTGGVANLVAGTSYRMRVRASTPAVALYQVQIAFPVAGGSDGGTGGGGDDGGGGTGGGGPPTPEPGAIVAESEPNDEKGTADAFAAPSSGLVQLVGSARNRRDRDFFQFVAPASGSLSAAVRSTGAGRARLQVEDSAGNSLFETQPNDGVNGGRVNLAAGQTYFLRLRSANNAAAAYMVDLLFDDSTAPGGGTGGGGDDGGGDDGGGGGGGGTGGGGSVVAETELNNERSLANAFAFDAAGAATLTGTSQNREDRDFFVMTPTRSGQVTALVASTGGPVAQLEVEDAAGLTIFETEPNDGINGGRFQVTAGRVYYVRMRAVGDVASAYRVSLSLA